jgi:hypothetical protein
VFGLRVERGFVGGEGYAAFPVVLLLVDWKLGLRDGGS